MKEETINRVNIIEHLIKEELAMIGKTLMDAVDDDNWQFDFPMTRNQFQQYRSSIIPLLKKTFKINKRKAESIFNWYWKLYGLRIRN